MNKKMIFSAFQAAPAGEKYEEELLSLVASVEAQIESDWGGQIVKIARQNMSPLHPVIGFQDFPGQGRGGAVSLGSGLYRAVVIGNREFLKELGLNTPETLEVAARAWTAAGAEVRFAGWDGWVRGIFKFAPETDSLPEAAAPL